MACTLIPNAYRLLVQVMPGVGCGFVNSRISIMKIEETYFAVSGFFDLWIRLMEIRTRIMEVEDSRLNNSRILIISPPTDRGIKVLARANPRGETHLLCLPKGIT